MPNGLTAPWCHCGYCELSRAIRALCADPNATVDDPDQGRLVPVDDVLHLLECKCQEPGG